MAAATLALRSRAWQVTGRQLTTCAGRLRPLEERITAGLQARLAAFSDDSGGATPCVAVAGRHSAEFVASMRAVRAAGAVAAPVDLGRCDAMDTMQRLAEAQAQFTVIASADVAEEAMVRDTSRRLSTPTSSAFALYGEGSEMDVPAVGSSGSSPPLFLFSSPPRSGSTRAAVVPHDALSTRINAAVEFWGFNERDVVLSLGLEADSPSAIVDAVEAPLAAGASVALPSPSNVNDSPSRGDVSDLWAAIRDEKDATVVFIDADWCWRLVDAYDGLAASLRSELSMRWSERTLRHTVALARPGAVHSQGLADRWAEIFSCPLTWHFSSAEVGSLFRVSPSSHLQASPEGRCAAGLQWRIAVDGELWAHTAGMFEGYHGRAKTTREMFDPSDGYCRTFHRVKDGGQDVLLPEPLVESVEFEHAVETYLTHGPGILPPPNARMSADWTVPKVPIRIYDMWRTAWGGLDYTKKHNTANKVYSSKYR